MKITIIDCFNSIYEIRTKYLVDYFLSKGLQIQILASNFSHKDKRYIDEIKNENKDLYKLIDSKPYKKNISLKRLRSHYDFSKKVSKELILSKPDIIYAMIPPNSIAKALLKFKKKNNIKIIIDIIDLWPESLPIPKIHKLLLAFPFRIWKSFRNKKLHRFDKVILECGFYAKYIPRKIKYDVLYLSGKEKEINYNISVEQLKIVYLGSINNIIDIDFIVKILLEINKFKKIEFVIIGGGERKDYLLHLLSYNKLQYTFFGEIFDENSKKDIFAKCNLALNIMKPNVCVGLTMKSIDYFSCGLPIINNIKGDTTILINDYSCGFNVDYYNIMEISKKVANLSLDEFNVLSMNAIQCFKENFSYNVFMKKAESILSDLIEKNRKEVII